MCTIGAIRNETTGASYFFKNVDQTDAFEFDMPRMISTPSHTYLKLPSGATIDDPGVWAGVNDAGLVVLGADGNCLPNYTSAKYSSLNESLVIYEKALINCTSAFDAMCYIMSQYNDKNIGGNGDIILVGDRKNSIALEYTPGRWGVQFQGSEPYLVRSNFFILMEHLRPQPEENSLHLSSAIRYQDAMEILSMKGKDNGLDDVFTLVKSHRHGPSALSICRHGGRSEYMTQCCLVVELLPDTIKAHVAMNQKPCEAQFRTFSL